MSDESDQKDYQDYLEYQKHISTPKAPAPDTTPKKSFSFGGQGADAQEMRNLGGSVDKNAVQAGIEGFGQTATMGYLPQAQAAVGSAMGLGKYVDLRDQNIQRQSQQSQESPVASAIGKGAGIASTMAIPGGGAAEGASLGARAATGAAQGFGMGAAYNPGDKPGVVDPVQGEDRLKSGGLMALLGGAAPAVSSFAGGLGDFLMQKSVGLKKYIPGAGKTLANEGLWGTKGMMENQVESGLQRRGSEIGTLAKDLGDVSTSPVADRLQAKADKLVGPDGTLHPDNQKEYDMLQDAIAESGKTSSVSGDVAAFRRSDAGSRARKAGAYRDNPSETMKAQIASTEQGGYSQAMKDKYAENNPGQPNALADADSAYGTLSKARATQSKPSQIPYSMLGLAAKTGIGAGLGYAAGGATGALAGAALGTPLGLSSGGRATIGASKAIDATAVPALRAMLEGKRN